jgi:Cation transport ATPase
MAEDISIDLMRHRQPEIAIDLAKTTLVTTTYSVTGMTCSSCVASVERSLNSLTGVRASVNFASETVHVLAPEELPTDVIISKIKSQDMAQLLLADSQGQHWPIRNQSAHLSGQSPLGFLQLQPQ